MFVVQPSGENCPNATEIVGMAAMDFKRVIELIVINFDQCKIEYAFIGGFAAGALGCLRSTMDVDPPGKKRGIYLQLTRFFSSHLYRLLYRSENVSQYVADVNFGEY